MARSNRNVSQWLGLFALAGFWVMLVLLLGAQWSVYPQYAYGWSVPCLMLVLLWRRWETRPNPAPPDGATSTRPVACAVATAAVLTFLLLPTRLVQEANPIWRAASWSMALEMVGLSLCLAYQAGGRSWLKHFAFPLVFFLVSVPWPSQPEHALIQALTGLNARATVEALNLCGLPALMRGNVIEISAGLVGIDEACSGVRSFQATLMISLFLGEVQRLNPRGRMLLVLSGIVLALLGNFCRTFLLVWVCAWQGMEALHRWHDPAGISILLACFVGLWLVSVWLRRKTVTSAPAQPDTQPRSVPQLLPAWSAALLAIWLILTEAGTQIWFRSHESPSTAPAEWSVQWPTAKPHFEEQALSDNVRLQLNYDEGKSASWREDDGSQWQAYYFCWRPGRTLRDRVRIQFARTHRPESCLPATGLTLQTDFGICEFTVGGLRLPFHKYLFEDRGNPLHVYFCVWEDGGSVATSASMCDSASARLEAVWKGNRSLGQRVLEIAVWGIADAQEAETLFRQQLEELIRK
jgi:exosortase